MARLLYRLGYAVSRHALLVVVAWLLIALGAGGAYAGLHKPLSAEFTLPGSDFGTVLTHLKTQIPAVAGGTGTVVFHTQDGTPFTEDQKRAIADTEDRWGQLPGVIGVVDPFSTQARLDKTGADVAAGRTKVSDGGRKLSDGYYQVAQLQWLVDQGKTDIADLESTDPDNATLAARRSGQEKLEKQLVQARATLSDAQTAVDAGNEQLADGQTLAELSSSVRFVSTGGSAALGQIRFERDPNSMDPAVLAAVPDAGTALAKAGVHVEYGQEIVHVNEPGGIGEVIGVIAAGLVLLLMLGSAILAGLPLVVGLAGVGVSLGFGIAATHWLTLHQMAPILGTMLGLAVGIDYALFIVNRYRHELEKLPPQPSRDQLRRSLAMAVGTAGSAVGFAGATVLIALAALLVSGIPLLVQMGLLAAFTVLVTVLVALTLLPALLALVGRRALPRRQRDRRDSHTRSTAPAGPEDRSSSASVGRSDRRGDRRGAGRTTGRLGTWPERWVGFVTKRAGLVVAAVVLLIGLIAVPALDLRLGLPDGGTQDKGTTGYKAYSLIRDNFGAGANGPIVVTADVADPIPTADVAATQSIVERAIAGQPGVSGILPIGESQDRTTLAFQVLATDGPASATTVDVVNALRGPVTDSLAKEGITLGVTGTTAANIEVSQRLASALPLYLVLVVGLSLALLALVFRSLVVPVIATAGFLLSVAGSFGAVVAVYQWGWLGSLFGVNEPEAVLSFMPTLLIGILFGLAMDYQMFLVSGMHEARAHGADARTAVRAGYLSAAKVVAAAAFIMVAVFAGFIHTPMTMARPIGFGLAVGVLLDAFLVRLTLTPALMHLLGDRAWWMPAWLDRVLPNLDVEGTSLERHAPQVEPDVETVPEPEPALVGH